MNQSAPFASCDIMIAVTPEELDRIAAIVGGDRIQRLIMAENGVPAFITKALKSWSRSKKPCPPPSGRASKTGTS